MTEAGTRTRPTGYAPRSTSLGLAGYMMLSVGTPLLAIQSLIPVLANGLDVWLGSILPVLAFAMSLMVIVILGLHKRRYWFINYLFYSGSVLLAAYPAGFLLGVAVLLRLLPLRHPDQLDGGMFNIALWLILAPFAWLLLRMLRLRYWQPWTQPSQWEAGDEAPPSWAPAPMPSITRRNEERGRH